MKKTLTLGAVCAIAFASCNKENVAVQGDLNAGLPAKPQAHIPVDANGLITKNFLSQDTVWLIDGVSYVRPGQTLTIEAGTFLTSGNLKTYNDPLYGTHQIRGVLVVPKTAKLNAIGTATAPIVFTSPNAAGSRNPGDFGGVILLGRARINQSTATRIEGVPQPDGTDVTYGTFGADTYNGESSGTLRYVRIEFAGYNLNANNEINGLTLGGVGSGTELSHIQVSWGRDDAFEFFGGTVNADHLVALSADDDDFDFDFGYSGTITYGLSLKDPNATNSLSGGVSDANGIESDNDGTGSAASPKTNPKLNNFTFLGLQNSATAATKLRAGNRWRRATSMTMQRSIIAGYPTGVAFEGITSTGSTFSNNLVHGYTAAITGTPTPANYTGNGTSTAANANSYLLLSGNPFYSTASAATFDAFNLVPTASSPAYGTASTYKGAFDPAALTTGVLWTDNWTQFQPKTY
ncbi:hypothetical protein [Sphingobacterium griseoflavum]|uniref:T9SS C-terminal target domain-containing protein n=1 Tax=Sphingobacterium griseoflavum TaxID=1474952 RepID=A0ABQ3HQH9_9SPHI|nr:hypothetical protein [Sphingobacterium griseoflavum]GHE23379.1 hypothetical protein GCM10017764_03470 [Sphingobacterium griseoflavum]